MSVAKATRGKFRCGDRVRWTSQSGGTSRVKEGVIVSENQFFRLWEKGRVKPMFRPHESPGRKLYVAVSQEGGGRLRVYRPRPELLELLF